MSFDLRLRRRPVAAVGNPFAQDEEIPFARKGICFSQHDMNAANASGATVRADLNNALVALATLSSGATEPSTTFAYQPWADTSAGLLKQRNAANTAWEVRDTLAETLGTSRATNTILGIGDYRKFFIATGSFTQTLTAAATLGDGWYCFYRVNSGQTVTIDPNSSENIDGATTKVVVGPGSGVIFCDGSAFFTYGLDQGPKDPTMQVFTSGGTWNRPAGARRVIVEVIGGGGGSGGVAASANGAASPGGGSGGYARKLLNVTGIASSTITIGAAGTAGNTTPTAGGAGGNSSWADGTNTITANGGGGGQAGGASTALSGGAGGTATGGDVNIVGQAGLWSAGTGGTVFAIGGAGGSNPLGFGGPGATAVGSANGGNVGSGYGAGAGGCATAVGGSARNGAAGTAGIVIVWEFY